MEKLRRALQIADAAIEVVGVAGSIEEALQWLRENPPPELIFLDIELSDGLSFSIFEKTEISCPIIFTTAFDEYWQEAFEHNSIDYLLKPLRQEKLELALKKYHSLQQHFAGRFKQLLESQAGGTSHKKRFLVKRGTDYISIPREEVAYFYATHKLVCLVAINGQKYILDQSLAQLEKQADPALFYRVNRKYLMSLNAIKRMKALPKSKLQLEVDPPVQEEIIISAENLADFKSWMDR